MTSIKLKSFCLFVLLFSFLQISFSQDNSFNPFANVMPASPTAASLAKYGDIPVGLHTGTPEISIPIYNLQGKNISVPISLSYHASGMRVEELASWVGFGWSLNAGGVISRTIRGKADEEWNGYMLSSTTLPPLSANEEELCQYFRDVLEEEITDSEPDVFYFNVNGFAGEFFFDQDGNAYTVPYQNVIITRLDANGQEIVGDGFVTTQGFKLVTPDGIQYIFGLTDANGVDNWEQNHQTSTCYENIWNSNTTDKISTTSWFLSKIIHPNRGEVRFNYIPNNLSYDANVSETKYMHLAPGTSCPSESPIRCYSHSLINTVKLASIETEYEGVNYGKIEFEHLSGRLDLEGGVKLSKIKIYGTNNELLKYFKFEQDYFFSGSQSPEFEDYRLRLLSVQEFSSNNEPIPPYQFEYIQNNFFPNRKSKDQDHWGYYNLVGGSHNTTLIPPHTYGTVTVGSANREPDASAMQAAMLDKITYPAGGYTNFKYEPNSIPVSITTEIINRSNTSTANCINTPVTNQTPFTILETTDVLFTPFFNVGSNSIVFDFRAEVYKVGDPNPLLTFNFNNTAPVSQPLPAGDYYLETYAAEPGTYSTITAEWQEEVPLNNPIYEKMVGGLRIKKITDHDGMSVEKNKIRRFIYDMTVDSITSSSGVLNRLPNYEGVKVTLYNPDTENPWNCAYESLCNYRSFTSVSNVPLTYKNGNVVGYRQVRTIYPENGSTLTKFTIAVDNGVNSFPYPPLISNNWKKGLILEQIDYDEGGTEVRKIENSYTFDESGDYGSARGITPGLIWQHPSQGGACEHHCREYAAEFYERKSTVAFLDQTTETIDGVSVTRDYIYDPDHLNPLMITFTNSDGKQHITEREYPKEANVVCLKDKHMDNTLVKEIRKVDGAIVGGIETSFKSINGQCLPEKVYEILEGGTPLLRTTLDFYTDGNLKHYIKRGFAPETYTWNTNDQLTSRSFLNFNWNYTYYPNNRQLQSITDIKGLTSNFYYDNFQRLKGSNARNGGLNSTHKYHYDLAGSGTPNYVEAYTSEDNVTRQNYIDGLGRPLQTLSLKYGPGMEDVAHGAVEYDEFGRVERQFQPHPGGNGSYQEPGGPHDRFEYEDSPLSRELKRIFADGTNMRTEYASNTSSDAVANYQTSTPYADGELYKVTVYDEKSHPTITFKDKIGRVILIRKKWDGNNVDTYYKYDDRDNLLAVMPPGCSSPTDIHIGYQYDYDERNRMKNKKLPGAGQQIFGYNDRDEVVSSTDGNGNVVGYEYDGHGRDTLTLLQKPFAQQPVPIIYKQYDGNGGGSMGELVNESKSILNSGSQSIQTSYSYDEYGRVRRMQDGAYRGGSDNFEYTYEAATDRVSQIIRNYGQFGWQERYLYDHVGREKVQLHKMTRGSLYDSRTTTTRSSEYDIKDQLISKSLDYLQNIGYGYDIRGRLTRINKLPLPFDDSYAPIECGGSGGSPPPPPPPNNTACGGQEVGLEDLLDIIASDETPEIDCPTDCNEEESPEICDFTASGAGHIICGIEDANGINVLNYDPPLAIDDPAAPTTIENDLETFLTTYNFVYDALSVTIGNGGIEISLTGTTFNLGGIDVCFGNAIGAIGNCQQVDGFPTGTPGQVGQQQASMQTLSGVMANTTINTVQYPTTLYKVNLYEREVAFVLESERDIIEGEQTTDDCVEVESPTSVISFNENDHIYQKSFSEVLQLRQGTSLDNSRFEGDSDCETELPKCSLVETYDAKAIQSSQVITSALPASPPYYDLSGEPGKENGVIIDNRFWTANNIAYGECAWDVSFNTGGSNVNVLAYSVKIKGTADPDASLPPGKIRLALHNGLDFVQINEGNGTFTFFDTNGQLGEVSLTVADSQYISPYQLENLVLAMHVESAGFSIDGVEVTIEYEAPCEACDEVGVPCSAADRAAQQIDVENLQNAFLLANANQYTYPLILHQVEFCDGSRLYVLDNELSTISGPYAIFQDIGIDSATQTFNAYIGTTDSLMTFADFIELRKTNNNLTLDSPGCPVSVEYDQENFCGYSLEIEGASYANIPNSNQVKVAYTEVIKEQCGSGAEIEHSRSPAEATIVVQKKMRVSVNHLVPNQGHLKDLSLKTLNPSGSLLIDLNPNTAGSGMNNFDPNDLRFNGTNIDVLLTAVRRVIDHEIEEWKNSNGVTILLHSYDLWGNINTTTGRGNVQISFSLYHQVTDAYIALDPSATISLTYSRNGADHLADSPSLALSQEPINVSSGNAPCPAVSVTYIDNVIDDQNVSFNQIPVVTAEPTPTRLYGSDCSFGSPSVVSACDRPKRLWNGTEFEECDYCTPDPPVCSDADMQAQQAYVDSIKNLYTTIDTSDLILPDSLHQVMLCDGSIIYIFGQHLDNIPGGTTTVQSIPVGSTGQTFEVATTDTTDLFAMRLYYEPNGNVEKVRWQVKFQPEQQYKFKYDDLDRMEESTYSGQGWLSNASYSENVTYKDGRGNIKTLTRGGYNGACSYDLIDDLDYTYDQGNKVIRIEDKSGNDRGFKYKPGGPDDEYRYDGNANMVYDWHKSIDTIGYNYLNLPGSITLGGSPLNYIYDAAGKKHRSPGPYDYVNNTHYSPDGFEAVYTDEGRVVPIFNDSLGIIDSFQYEWTIRDHLGNGRVYFSDLDKNLGISSQTPQELLQERHYYPFGLMYEGPFYPQVGPQNEYTYNGKRFHREGELNLYDYGARWYDGAVARWWNLDPLADQMRRHSPYNYAFDNPMRYVDPDGMAPENCPGCGWIAKRAANMAAEAGWNRLAGALDVMAGTDFVYSNFEQTKAIINAESGTDLVKAVDPTGLTSLPETISAAVNGDERAQGQLAAGVVLTVIGSKAGNSKGRIPQGPGAKGSKPVKPETGSYTNTHESGKKYHGKGGAKRANKSASDKASKYNDPLKKQDWKAAKNDREAFKDEALRMFNDGGHQNPNNYNKRRSPGERYIKEDNKKQ